jgi:hypothetical protein
LDGDYLIHDTGCSSHLLHRGHFVPVALGKQVWYLTALPAAIGRRQKVEGTWD